MHLFKDISAFLSCGASPNSFLPSWICPSPLFAEPFFLQVAVPFRPLRFSRL